MSYNRPIRNDRLPARTRAAMLGEYCRALIAFRTFSWVSTLTFASLFSTRDTVLNDTPAFLATSWIVTARLVSLGIRPGVAIFVRIRSDARKLRNSGNLVKSGLRTCCLNSYHQATSGEERCRHLMASEPYTGPHRARSLQAIENRSSLQTPEGTPPRCRIAPRDTTNRAGRGVTAISAS